MVALVFATADQKHFTFLAKGLPALDRAEWTWVAVLFPDGWAISNSDNKATRDYGVELFPREVYEAARTNNYGLCLVSIEGRPVSS